MEVPASCRKAPHIIGMAWGSMERCRVRVRVRGRVSVVLLGLLWFSKFRVFYACRYLRRPRRRQAA